MRETERRHGGVAAAGVAGGSEKASVGGAPPTRHIGQFSASVLSSAAPSSLRAKNFSVPEVVQTTSSILGWNIGVAVAAPSDIKNHASTHKRNRAMGLVVFMRVEYRFIQSESH